MGNARRVPLETTEATAIALEDLIALTRRVGWPRDLEDIPAKQAEDLNRDFEAHRLRQARLGLALSPAERLRWLEQSMEPYTCGGPYPSGPPRYSKLVLDVESSRT